MARSTHFMIPVELYIHREPTSFERPPGSRSHGNSYFYDGKPYEYEATGARFLADLPGGASLEVDLQEIVKEGLRALDLPVKDVPGARSEMPIHGAWEVRVERKIANDGEDIIVVDTHTLHPQAVLTERTAINLVTNLIRAIKQIQNTDIDPGETRVLVP